jgi:Protein of unknown function (DUF3040)
MHDGDLTQQERNNLEALERGLGADDPAFLVQFRRDARSLGRGRAGRVWRRITRPLRPRH